MKKFLLTTTSVLTILFVQAQILPCQANFSYMQNGPTTVFTDLSTMQSTNYSVTWQWDFGDGNTSTQQNPIHTYSNGIYAPCLTVTFLDSTLFNYCTAIYCDSILIGNSIPASWDCNPTTGCYDPGTGLGQYSSFASCDTMCGAPTPSWDCPTNTPGGCYDPGTGNGQYATLVACQAVCGTPTPSWDCPTNTPGGCYDPGTGNGQYSSLAACQAVCVITVSNACDSMTLVSTGGSPQTMLVAEVPISFMDIHYWITTALDGTVLGEDSMWNSHQIYNNMNNGQPYDTINICITYIDNNAFNTCCVTWIWDVNSSVWAKVGSVTSLDEMNLDTKKLIKIVDVLGRETFPKNKQILFYIYEDGTIDKKYIIE
tara:strand:+ start:227 stop:1336 length:1110 start_codon:yes stop_codon:yes gene_type:complete